MTQPLRVLHLIDSLSVGGAERLILGLAERLDRSRFDIHVVCLGVQRGNALQSDFERLRVPLQVIGSRRFYDPRAALKVGRYVLRERIDIVHTHLTSADIIGRVVGRALGRPVVSTLQNEPRNYDRDRVDRRLLERLSARRLATRLVAVAPSIRQMFIDQWGISETQVLMIPNAVPMEAYTAIEAEPSRQQGPMITNIGRLSPQKAQDRLLAAAAQVFERRPDARLMIVGQGRLEDQLKAQAAALGIADKVIFTGLRHDIPAVLADTDVFVLSSLWEGLPLTAVEAMAAARPVVLTDVGGNRDIVEHGVHGLLVPPGDVEALAAALLELLDNPARRVTIGRAARARVQHEFSIDTITAQHERLYEAIRPAALPLARGTVAPREASGRQAPER